MSTDGMSSHNVNSHWRVLSRYIQTTLALDLRSLAVFRVGLGVLVIFDLLFRSQDFVAHYTDAGVLPRIEAIGHNPIYRYSFHLAVGDSFGMALLFAAHAILALLFAIGWRTRPVGFLLWLFTLSLQNRNYMIVQGGDRLLHLLLFYAIFLPVSSVGSLESVSKSIKDPEPPRSYFSIMGFALLVQLILVYVFNATHKLEDVSWQNGLGVFYAFGSDQLATPLGSWIARIHWLTPLLTHGTIILEFMGPWFLFVPSRKQILRSLICAIFISFHLFSASCLEVGLFPFIASVAWTVFIPEEFWNSLRNYSFSRKLRDSWQYILAHVPITNSPFKKESDFFKGISDALGIILILSTIWWNLGNLPESRTPSFAPLHAFGMMSGIEQKWNMFAHPIVGDGWYVMPGYLTDGTLVNVRQFHSEWTSSRWHNDEQPSWEKPKDPTYTIPRDRWRKFMMNMQNNAWGDMMKSNFGRYVCRTWNAHQSPEKHLEAFFIYFVREDRLPTMEIAAPARTEVWRHQCNDFGFTFFEARLEKFTERSDAPPEYISASDAPPDPKKSKTPASLLQ